MLEGRELSKHYGKRTVVNGVSYHVNPGEIVGLLGKNGAGKTTTFMISVGLIKPDSGNVYLNNVKITNLPMYKRARMGIGYLPQETSVFRGLTARQNILSVTEMTGMPRSERKSRTEELIKSLGLQKVQNNTASSLSGGEKRRLEIARALITNPSVLLLDEPFTGIDPLTVAEVKAIVVGLVQRNLGVLITDHNVRDTLSITDRAYILEDGKILASGTPLELIHNKTVCEAYLGEDFSTSLQEEIEHWKVHKIEKKAE
ncbi:MAG: LPS export ABC transporter ATP-binding protein [Planctomycetota bacterium]